METNNQIPITGDLLLVKGSGVKSGLLAEIQTPASGLWHTPSDFSHVAICLNNSLFIHSTSQRGVHLENLRSILCEVEENWIAVRHCEIEKLQENNFEHVYKRCSYYLSQKYNFRLSLKSKIDETSFCSELACKIYEDLGVKISNKTPKRTFPIHIQNQINNDSWSDVTEIYKKYLKYADIEIEQMEIDLATSLHQIQHGSVISEMTCKALKKMEKTCLKQGLKTSKIPEPNHDFPFWNSDKEKT